MDFGLCCLLDTNLHICKASKTNAPASHLHNTFSGLLASKGFSAYEHASAHEHAWTSSMKERVHPPTPEWGKKQFTWCGQCQHTTKSMVTLAFYNAQSTSTSKSNGSTSMCLNKPRTTLTLTPLLASTSAAISRGFIVCTPRFVCVCFPPAELEHRKCAIECSTVLSAHERETAHMRLNA